MSEKSQDLCAVWAMCKIGINRLLSNTISWEYITEILAFCNHCFFFFFKHVFVDTSSFSGCSALSTEEQINLKLLVSLEEIPWQTLEMLQQVYGDSTMVCTRVFDWHKKFTEEHKLQEWEVFNKQDWGQHWLDKGGDIWWSINQSQLYLKKTVLDYHWIAEHILEEKKKTVCAEYLATPGWKEYYFTEITSLFLWSCSMRHYLFSKLKGNHFEGMEAIKRAVMGWNWVASLKNPSSSA